MALLFRVALLGVFSLLSVSLWGQVPKKVQKQQSFLFPQAKNSSWRPWGAGVWECAFKENAQRHLLRWDSSGVLIDRGYELTPERYPKVVADYLQTPANLEEGERVVYAIQRGTTLVRYYCDFERDNELKRVIWDAQGKNVQEMTLLLEQDDNDDGVVENVADTDAADDLDEDVSPDRVKPDKPAAGATPASPPPSKEGAEESEETTEEGEKKDDKDGSEDQDARMKDRAVEHSM